MKKYLPSLIALAGAVVTIFGPAIQHWVSVHPEATAVVAGLYAILSHIAPSPVTPKG